MDVWNIQGRGGVGILGIGSRQHHQEGCQAVLAFRRDRSAVERHDLFCNGKSQTRPAGIGNPGVVQTEEFLKNGFQLVGGNGFALVSD